MPTVLRDLPYFDGFTQTRAHQVTVEACANQIIVWVSVTRIEDFELPKTARPFPAILDTGFTDSFYVGPVHLADWAGLRWETLPEEGNVRNHGGIWVPQRRALLWLYPNKPNSRDEIDQSNAFGLELTDGITVYGNRQKVGSDPKTIDLPAKRLPLIGLGALTDSKAQLHVDGDRRLVRLDFPDLAPTGQSH